MGIQRNEDRATNVAITTGMTLGHRRGITQDMALAKATNGLIRDSHHPKGGMGRILSYLCAASETNNKYKEIMGVLFREMGLKGIVSSEVHNTFSIRFRASGFYDAMKNHEIKILLLFDDEMLNASHVTCDDLIFRDSVWAELEGALHDSDYYMMGWVRDENLREFKDDFDEFFSRTTMIDESNMIGSYLVEYFVDYVTHDDEEKAIKHPKGGMLVPLFVDAWDLFGLIFSGESSWMPGSTHDCFVGEVAKYMEYTYLMGFTNE